MKLLESISEKNNNQTAINGMNENKIKEVIKSTYAEALKDNTENHEEMKGALKQVIFEKQKEDNNRIRENPSEIILYSCTTALKAKLKTWKKEV